MGSSSGETLVFVGTYTKSTSKGIYTFRMDNATGTLSQIAVAGGTEDPSFLAIHPNGKYLYATSEIDNFGGETSGAVAAYAIDSRYGRVDTAKPTPVRWDRAMPYNRRRHWTLGGSPQTTSQAAPQYSRSRLTEVSGRRLTWPSMWAVPAWSPNGRRARTHIP